MITLWEREKKRIILILHFFHFIFFKFYFIIIIFFFTPSLLIWMSVCTSTVCVRKGCDIKKIVLKYQRYIKKKTHTGIWSSKQSLLKVPTITRRRPKERERACVPAWFSPPPIIGMEAESGDTNAKSIPLPNHVGSKKNRHSWPVEIDCTITLITQKNQAEFLVYWFIGKKRYFLGLLSNWTIHIKVW